MRNPLACILTSGLFMLTLPGTAQMIPVTTTLKTPYGPVKTTYYVGSPISNNYTYGTTNMKPVKYDLNIVLNNDSLITTRVRIEPGDPYDEITLKDNKTGNVVTIQPGDTKKVYRINSYREEINGMPADSCWWFYTAKGKINLYSSQPSGFTPSTSAFQVKDGPILPLKKETLLAVLPDDADEKVLKFIARNKLVDAVLLYNQD